jgi:hypothetical protein
LCITEKNNQSGTFLQQNLAAQKNITRQRNATDFQIHAKLESAKQTCQPLASVKRIGSKFLLQSNSNSR